MERDQIVVTDNLQVHEMRRARDLIEGRGCSLIFLPGYSPDSNLVEEAFSKVKTLLRKTEVRTSEVLVEATGRALFAHCGSELRGLLL